MNYDVVRMFHKILQKKPSASRYSCEVSCLRHLVQHLTKYLSIESCATSYKVSFNRILFNIFRKNLVIHLPLCQLYPKYKRLLKAK